MELMRCENLSLAYDGLVALSEVSFSIKEADYLCILGDNGTGKSTLLRAILGLKRLHKGIVSYENGLKKSEIGYLAQQTDVQKEFPASVMEVVLSGCIAGNQRSPFYKKDQKERARKALQTLDITELSKSCYCELSGGQQQRVMLARAICAAKRVLVLDEPTTGLDPKMTTEFFDLMQRMNQEEGVAIVMVTHDIHCATKYSKHILHLGEKTSFYGSCADYRESELGKHYIGGHRHD